MLHTFFICFFTKRLSKLTTNKVINNLILNYAQNSYLSTDLSLEEIAYIM
jgi:hypothetical protein